MSRMAVFTKLVEELTPIVKKLGLKAEGTVSKKIADAGFTDAEFTELFKVYSATGKVASTAATTVKPRAVGLPKVVVPKIVAPKIVAPKTRAARLPKAAIETVTTAPAEAILPTKLPPVAIQDIVIDMPSSSTAAARNALVVLEQQGNRMIGIQPGITVPQDFKALDIKGQAFSLGKGGGYTPHLIASTYAEKPMAVFLRSAVKGGDDAVIPLDEFIRLKKTQGVANTTIDTSWKPITSEGFRKKGFANTVVVSPKTTPELSKEIRERFGRGITDFYKQQGHDETIQRGMALIAKDFDGTLKWVKDEKSVWTAEKSAAGQLLGKHFESLGQFDEVTEIVVSLDRQGRVAGRANESLKLWGVLNPATIAKLGSKAAKDITGKDLPDDLKKILIEGMSNIRRMDTSTPELLKAKDDAMLNLMNHLAEEVHKGIPLRKRMGSWLTSYRYQNMLSSPITSARNIESGLFNTFVVRPLDMIGEATYDLMRHPSNPLARDMSFADVPRYYKEIAKALPEAFIGAREAFAKGFVSSRIIEGGDVHNMISRLVRTKQPRYLTVVPRFMEATDNFFSILIGQGEKARLIANGVENTAATAQAKKLAERYLFRDRLGQAAKDADEPYLIRALDGLGDWALNGRKRPVAGTIMNFFVPFITTPTNIAKQMVRYSPLAAIGGSHSKEQIVKAGIGSILMGVSAVAAMQGRTCFLPPKDAELRKVWYASGRKTNSFNIPNPVTGEDNWIPIAYFYPFSLALVMPMVWKHFNEESKEALTDSQIAKMGKSIMQVANYATSQSSLTGIEGFLKVVQGDTDYRTAQQMGFISEQAFPMSGLGRWLNTILDPVYRKPKGYIEQMQKDYPYLFPPTFSSKDIAPYPTVTGEPAKREPFTWMQAYPMGTVQPEWEKAYQSRLSEMQKRYLAEHGRAR